eukprot:4728254-Pleurochrysis_carterae.AAC.1
MRTFGGPSAEGDPESNASERDATVWTTTASRVSTESHVSAPNRCDRGKLYIRQFLVQWPC